MLGFTERDGGKVDLFGLERRIAIQLETDHLLQVFLRRGGQIDDLFQSLGIVQPQYTFGFFKIGILGLDRLIAVGTICVQGPSRRVGLVGVIVKADLKSGVGGSQYQYAGLVAE